MREPTDSKGRTAPPPCPHGTGYGLEDITRDAGVTAWVLDCSMCRHRGMPLLDPRDREETERPMNPAVRDALPKAMDAVLQQGGHCFILGDRRKTLALELVNATRELDPDTRATSSRFSPHTAWRNVLAGIQQQLSPDHANWPGTPHGITQAALEADRRCLIVIEGLEHLQDPAGEAALTDTLKSLSDRVPGATAVMTGDRESLIRVLQGHPSVGRSIIHVSTDPPWPNRRPGKGQSSAS